MKDLIILGNGMAGMTAALYAARANLDFKIVGKSEYDFGQIGNAILVENFPCVENQSGFDLACKLHDQLQSIGIKIEEGEVSSIIPTNTTNENINSPFTIKYADGTGDSAKTIIYALGARHRQLDCEIEEGIPIHYCALCDGNFYKDKIVTVIGGGDSAFTQAEYLSKICKNVLILMCDNNITANAQLVNRVKNIQNIYISYDFPIKRITKTEEGHYHLASFICKSHSLVSKYGPIVNGIFVAIGMIPNTQPLKGKFDSILTQQGYIFANETGMTLCQGFYAAGDVRKKPVHQAITAAADGANAVQSVINYLKLYQG